MPSDAACRRQFPSPATINSLLFPTPPNHYLLLLFTQSNNTQKPRNLQLFTIGKKIKKKGFSPNYRTCSSEWPEPLTCAGICPPVEPACTQQHIPVSSFSTRTTGTGTNTPITLYRTGTVLQDNTIR
jgi:hypothetical protein